MIGPWRSTSLAAFARLHPPGSHGDAGSEHVRNGLPSDLALVLAVGIAERPLERPLLPRNRDDQIQRCDDGERDAIAGHVRRSEHRQHPAEVERMPDESVRSVDLQRPAPRTTGRRAGPAARGARGGTLQINGPYRLVRHPLYLGWMLTVFGAAHMTGDRVAFAVITSLYLVIAIPWEERSLERTFGDAYRQYKGEVRWKAIPYVF